MHPSFLNTLRQKERVKQKLAGIKHKIGIYSAKGGVGKTTIAVNVAYALKDKGFKVGLLDADIDCPNVTMFLGIEEKMNREYPLIPVTKDGIKVASTAMVTDELKKPIIWRGALITKMLGDFFENTDWGDLDYLVIDLPPGCLPGDTLVTMSNGFPKPIKDVKPGEFVLSYENGRLVKNKVINVISQGEQEVFKVKTPNRTIIASSNHPFLKYHRNLYWKKLSGLRAGDRIIVVNNINNGKSMKLPHPKESVHNTQTHITLPKVTNTDFMRIIGHFIGDGYVRINKKKDLIIGIRICEPVGSKFRKKYEKLYKKVFNCNIFPDGNNQFAVDSRVIVKLFSFLDLNHYARKKSVPEWVFSLPLEQRRAFIEGYSEADGCIRHRKELKVLHDKDGHTKTVFIEHDVVSLESTNERLIRQMHALCQISGIRSQNVRTRTKQGNIFPDGHSTRRSVSFAFEYSKKVTDEQFKIARIKSIEPIGYKETYDLQLEKQQSFIAEGMVVHNTSDAPLTVMQLLDMEGFVIVTTPQKIAAINSIRSGLMAKRLGMAVLGVVENMSGSKASDNTLNVANELGTEVIGTVKEDIRFKELSDSGKVPLYADHEVEEEFSKIVDRLLH